MKINRQAIQNDQLERAQGRQNEKVGSKTSDVQGSSRYQVGLDRVEVSNLAETAAQIVGKAAENREAHISKLSALRQAGELTVDPHQLAKSILDHDLEPSFGEC